jgi:hypothetical protein
MKQTEPGPEREVMPPPPSPGGRRQSSELSSSSRRPHTARSLASRHTKSSSAMSLVSTESYPKSDDFSTATKTEIKRLAGDSCWVCGFADPQICYVIGKQDKQVRDTIAAGSNGIWLTMFG